LIDRVFYGVFFGEGPLFYGKVVDFFDMDFFNIDLLGFHISRWPVFNIADASVSLGVLILLVFHRKFTQEQVPAVSIVNSPSEPSSSMGSLGRPGEATQSSDNPV
ncbi:MAG: signal peptidase II, partial [Bacteroidota bacterium]